jgi:hypothetical protein
MALRFFSYGGGVQSTAALVLAAQGKIDYPVFLFANVGDDSEHPGPVALSGFHCVMYDDRLRHWQAFERRMRVEGGQARTEVLWVNRTMNNMFPEIAS